jgi:8-oxo-dGTP diphosphatase
MAIDLNEEGEIRAAGGLVLRRTAIGPELILVHRPAFDDWTLPKGKARAGEADIAAARREVEEETGLACTVGRAIGRIHYFDRKGRRKVACFWEMEPVTGSFAASREVDRFRWIPVVEAARLLTRTGEREFVQRAALGLGIDAQQCEGDAAAYVIVHEIPDPALMPRGSR